MVKISLDARLEDGLGAKMTQEGHQELEKYKHIEFLGSQGAQHGAKIDKKTIRKLYIFVPRFGNYFFSFLG